MDAIARLRAALIALGAVLVIGTIGYVLLGFSALDAMYQTVTTVATVGFREVQPLDGTGKVFTMVLILLGVGSALYAFTVMLEVVVEGHLGTLVGRRRMDRQIASMQGHVIVCGWGRVGKAIARDLAASGRDFVVIDESAERVSGIDHPVVVGDATNDDVLRSAGIERASALVAAIATDAANLFVTLSGRALAPQLFIVARARDEASIDKLRRAGADRVVNPQELGGARMAAFVRQPHVAEFVDVVMHERSMEFRLEEVVLSARSPISGTTLRDAHIRDRTGALVLALRDGAGRFTTNPAPDARLEAGNVLIAIGTPDELAHLATLAGQ
ncbi:MAG: TrkA family potassium uptake protein [Acidimicrobiia bacterium]